MANISDLKFDHKNARKRTDSSARLIQESLQRYGAARSIVIDEDNRILAGNGTIEGAKALGLTKLKVVEAAGDEIIAVRRSGLSEDDKVGLALADNRAAELSDWDAEMLQQLSEEHDIAPWFDQEDLDALLEAAEQLEPVEGNTDPDDVPEPPADPVTKPGDLWILGNHRLLCGDSTDTVALERLTENQPADLWLTDPPYNVSYEGKTADALTIKNDSMSNADFRQFLHDVYVAANCFLKPGATFYIWHADSEGYNFRGAAHDVGWKVRQCLVWVKSVMVMGRQDYQWKHEPCLYGWTEGAAHTWCSDRKQTTVLEFDKPRRNGEHPTMKPVDLFQYLMANSTKPGAVVLDSFGGSGTTVIAAERLGRKARVMELDPTYCDVIVKRWEDFTGNTAVCIPSDSHFTEAHQEAA
ncbi:MAG: DNA modification methylase [Proteobacteria bacterium]|uniref:site-specific DNA-methyltransferase (adenine-specific) n=1 Tax=Candidatus Fonsibacter lacus TaxID=2576439 RepID=A0A964XRA7_9PROT|nr:DNA modification methylase [Candidatus Fonsibacter lacus]